MVANQYSYFLNQLKLGSSRRSLYFDARITTKTKPLVSILINLNVVRRYHKVNDVTYRVFPAYSRYRRRVRHYKTYTRVNGRIRLRKNALKLLGKLAPHTYYILDTDKGLLTHHDALKFGVGGALVLIVF